MSEAPAATRIALPFGVTALIWGSTWLVIHTQLGHVPPAWSVAWRFAIAAATMFALAVVRRQRLRFTAPEHALAATVGLFTFAANYNMVYAAEQHVTSGLVAVTFALLVPLNALLGRLLFGQRVTRAFLLGSAVAMAGVALLFLHELNAGTYRPEEAARGLLLGLAATLAASVGNVLQSGERAKAMPMAGMLAWGMSWGAGLDALIAWGLAGPPRFDLSAPYLAGLGYLAFVASALAFLLYFGLIRAIGPARAGYVNVLVPVIAMALSTIFEQYRWSLQAAAGGVLVVVGLVVATSARRPAR